MSKPSLLIITVVCIIFFGCNQKSKTTTSQNLIPIIIDTDANNEIDDQHALAYAFFNGDIFETIGVTVNATKHGGEIKGHYDEAKRVMKMCKVDHKTPLFAGANKDFNTIQNTIDQPDFDGHEAVNFIIAEARKVNHEKLVLVPIGKLTNIALALRKAPDIKDKIKVVWLGSNYPLPGEYNQDNDRPSMNYILDQEVEFEMVTVRYGEPSGSAAVHVTPVEMQKYMPGSGLKTEPVPGRHEKSFTCFGDYSINLFEKCEMYGNPPGRSLFDVVALAVLKNPNWGEKRIVPAPMLDLEKNQWIERPKNKRTITIWENFDKQAILEDFFESIRKPQIN